MEHKLEDTIAVLERTPAALKALLHGLPEVWTMHNEGLVLTGGTPGKETWTVRDVIAHLITTDRLNWLPRAKWLLEFGESRAFERVDWDGHSEEPVETLLEEFADVRFESLLGLGQLHLIQEDLDRRGLHPKFGIVTLSQLLATWAVHDLTHLHQISRIMAHQYRETVGSWSEFLGVLHCDGHGNF